jgi:hypothetical protein
MYRLPSHAATSRSSKKVEVPMRYTRTTYGDRLIGWLPDYFLTKKPTPFTDITSHHFTQTYKHQIVALKRTDIKSMDSYLHRAFTHVCMIDHQALSIMDCRPRHPSRLILSCLDRVDRLKVTAS